MAKTDDDKLIDQAEKQFNAMGNRPITIETDLVTAMELIGMVQVGLRHPNIKGHPTAKNAEKFVAELIEKIDPDHGEIWRLLNLGFNPDHDQP